MNKLLAYLQLFRIPNVFTAMADIAAGYLFVRGDLAPLLVFGSLLAASSLLYTAGMVLNDVYDYKQDLNERPDRPLPSGRIRRDWAMWLGYGMLLCGVVLAWLAGYLVEGAPAAALPWRSGVVATILAGCIVAYDAVMKTTILGPLFMGACRFLNLLLGMSTAGFIMCGGPEYVARFETGQLLVAGGMGVYIVGVTWFARTEAHVSGRWQLGGGLTLIVAGIALVGSYAWIDPRPEHFPQPGGMGRNIWTMWQLLLLLLGFTIARRAAMAVMDPTPQNVQAAVKQAILSVIVLDAAICLVAGPAWAIGVLALLAPTFLLGKWVYST